MSGSEDWSWGLLQKAVARQIGVTTDTLCRWERNAAAPQIHHFPKVIEFLG